MPHHFTTETAISAPGKVLLTGGYLVLDRNYTGTVFALNARIHVVVQQLQRGKKIQRTNTNDSIDQVGKDGDRLLRAGGEAENPINGGEVWEDEDDEPEIVTVNSPQFLDAVWEYRIQRTDNGGGVQVLQTNDGPRNVFVETSLNYALTYVSYVSASKSFGSLLVTILADNDYYSETAAARAPNTNSGGFTKFGVTLGEAHKTGLGSSAALVTALVSSIVIHRTVQPEELPNIREKLHNLAQAAHCAAQGKVGSGFDIGAAVYGSCLYGRFSPSVLSGLGEVGSTKFEDRLFSVVENLNSETPWDVVCEDVGSRLPEGMQMVLCDVDCGSQTPGMVKQVLAWREQNRQEADMIWTELQQNNEKLRLELKQLAQSRLTDQSFNGIRDFLLHSRSLIKSMTKKSGVPIEPMVQTELLDALGKIDGVVGGVVPGAGGYDAIALLIHDDPAVVGRVRDFLDGWENSVEDDFGGKVGKVRLLGVGHGSEGVKNELVVRYSGWI